jgi:hypothetical protein
MAIIRIEHSEHQQKQNLFKYVVEKSSFSFLDNDHSDWLTENLGPSVFRYNFEIVKNFVSESFILFDSENNWYNFADNYYFRRAEDAVMFKLANTNKIS